MMFEDGAQLRVAREAAGLSLAAMARETCHGKGYLGNVETGVRRVTREVVLAYARVIGDRMQRRDVLAGLAGLASRVVAPAAVGELIYHGFAAALTGPPDVDQWQARVTEYGRRYMEVGAAALQHDLAVDLVVLQQQLDHPQLWAAAARLLTVWGKTTPGAREAGRWYEAAAVAADRSEDLPTRVWVRGRAALALAYEGAGLTTATRMAGQALALSDRPSLGALNARVALAHAAGHRGDHATALAELDAGRRLFDRAASDEQISDFEVPEWRMATFESMLLSRLGHPQAAQAQDAADAARPDSLPRFATHIELHRALAMVTAGDKHGGLVYAREAMDRLPADRHSLSLRMMLAEVERAANGRQRRDG